MFCWNCLKFVESQRRGRVHVENDYVICIDIFCKECKTIKNTEYIELPTQIVSFQNISVERRTDL